VSVVPNESEVAAIQVHAENLGIDTERVHIKVSDDPAAGIDAQRAELNPCLVCMSTHGRGRLQGAVIGSVARSVLTASPAPLVAVGPFADRPAPFVESYRLPPLFEPRLVVCVDGEPASETVQPIAAAFARALDMSITVLTVAKPSDRPLRSDVPWRRPFGPQGDADLYMQRLRDTWRAAAPDVEVDGHVEYDPISVTSGIKAHIAMRPAGMLCVATNARTGFERVRLGAEAANIVRTSTLPVLVVPPDELAAD
jgi:nucleotide-binding universal stress UspA family protein